MDRSQRLLSIAVLLLAGGCVSNDHLQPSAVDFVDGVVGANVEQVLSETALIKEFEQGVFGPGRGYYGRTAERLKRWPEPIRIALISDAPRRIQALHIKERIQEFVARASTVRNISFAHENVPILGLRKGYPQQMSANLTIILPDADRNLVRFRDTVPSSLFGLKSRVERVLDRSSRCTGFYEYSTIGIVHGYFIIPLHLDKPSIMACLKSFLTDSLGVTGRNMQPFGPTQSPEDASTWLTLNKLLLLQVLYDRRLFNGSPRDTVMETLPVIVRELRAATVSRIRANH